MKKILYFLLFHPLFLFSQQDTVGSEADVRIYGKFYLLRLASRESIDSVFGKPDSVWTDANHFNPVISYPNADFSIYDSQHIDFDDCTFTKNKKEFFVQFGSQILTAETTMDDVKQHFFIWPYPYADGAEHIENISGIPVKVRSLEIYTPYSMNSDGPTWLFDFFENKLVRITFVPHGG